MRFCDLPGIPEFFLHWIEGEPDARAILPFSPNLLSLRERARETRIRDLPRGKMRELLESQSAPLGAGTLALKNIQRIPIPDSVVVLMSLPVALAGGPLALLLKCLTTAKLAADLEQIGIPAIPMCWIDREAGDEASALSIRMPDQEARLRTFTLESPAGREGNGSSDWPIPAGIGALFESLEESQGLDAQDATMHELRVAFAEGIPLAQASTRFISALLKEWGIVPLDPRSALFLESAIRLLEPSGFSRERATFICCRQEERLCNAGNRRPSGHYSGEESTHEEAPGVFPRRVSAGPFMPFFLEAVLPVAAHVIDRREIRDFAVAAPLFPEFHVRPPLLWPQASATILDTRSRKGMEKHALTFEDLLGGKADVIRRLARRDSAQEVITRLGRLSAAIDRSFQEVKKSHRSQGDLDSVLNDTQSRLLYQLGKLKERFATSIRQRQEIVERQAERICASLLPEGMLQEETVAALSFIFRHSTEFLPTLHRELNVHLFEHQLIAVE